jgi:glycosyltransferase involved in cell wall biosynthesis
MRLTLIITSYNSPEPLNLVLKSVEKQSILPNEIIIADDGSSTETRKIIDSFKNNTSLNIIHSWQENKGFRVAISRNKAIAKSSGEYIVLIDGDMILHSNFIEDHIRNTEKNYFVQGSRVLIDRDRTEIIFNSQMHPFSIFSKGLRNRKNLIHSNFLSKLFSSKKNYLEGVRSCNMGFFREDFININGFNNDFVGWGLEDSEFVIRMINSGIKRKTLRFNAVQYHLWHHISSKEPSNSNKSLLEEAIKSNLTYCKNGIKQYL